MILAYFCNLTYEANGRKRPFKVYIHPKCVKEYEVPVSSLDGAIGYDPNGHVECDFCHKPIRSA